MPQYAQLLHAPVSIRRWGTLVVSSCRMRPDGRRVLLLSAPLQSHGASLVRDAARRHAIVRSPSVPPLLREGSTPTDAWAVLDAPVDADVAELLTRHDPRLPTCAWAEVLPLLEAIVDSLSDLHEQLGEVLPALGYCNLLVADAEPVILLVAPPRETSGPGVLRVEAPEFTTTGAATPSSHTWLAWALVHALASPARAPEPLLSVLRGDASGTPFARAMTDLLGRVSHPLPQARIAPRAALASYLALLDGVGVSPDADCTRARFRHLLAARRAGAPSEAGLALTGRWLTLPDGHAVDLGRHRVIRELLRRLAQERLDHPGRLVPAEALVAAVWPDHDPHDPAVRNRLHAALSRLRALGIEAWLERGGDGYRLDPRIAVSLSER